MPAAVSQCLQALGHTRYLQRQHVPGSSSALGRLQSSLCCSQTLRLQPLTPRRRALWSALFYDAAVYHEGSLHVRVLTKNLSVDHATRLARLRYLLRMLAHAPDALIVLLQLGGSWIELALHDVDWLQHIASGWAPSADAEHLHLWQHTIQVVAVDWIFFDIQLSFCGLFLNFFQKKSYES